MFVKTPHILEVYVMSGHKGIEGIRSSERFLSKYPETNSHLLPDSQCVIFRAFYAWIEILSLYTLVYILSLALYLVSFALLMCLFGNLMAPGFSLFGAICGMFVLGAVIDLDNLFIALAQRLLLLSFFVGAPIFLWAVYPSGAEFTIPGYYLSLALIGGGYFQPTVVRSCSSTGNENVPPYVPSDTVYTNGPTSDSSSSSGDRYNGIGGVY